MDCFSFSCRIQFINMKLVMFCLGAVATFYAAPLKVNVQARSAILMNAETGAVLYEKDAHLPSYPASTTKIATALYLLEEKKIDLHQMVTVSPEALRYKPPNSTEETPAHWLVSDATLMQLVKGERLSAEALLHGLMMVSGNDAANVLAEAVSGSVPVFMDELNAYLKQIGCQGTFFKNPHGYHHPEHITTAYDLAWMTKKALQNQTFRELVSKQAYQRPKTNKQPAGELKQRNGLVVEGKHYYPKAIGVKTGFHSFAQNALVGAATDQGRTLVAVVLGCPKSNDRYNDTKALFEAAFAEKKVESILSPAGQAYSKRIGCAKTQLLAVLFQPLAISFYPSEEPKVKAFIHWDLLSLPIRKGQRVGEIRAVDERGAVLAKQELFAQDNVSATLLFSLKQKWNRLWGLEQR